ncbi:MAG TPA: HEAT repeat domain-containing protein [Bdellovibrionota bacterium]|nr:HEAT repeat domain-containing protein [Bdellovibrionota bacterium]
MALARDPVKEAGLVLTALDKAVRQFVLYGREHPQYVSALRDAETRLAEFLQLEGPLSLAVKRTDLEWKESPVFSIQKRENNYIQEMFVDGVRQLEFLPGITTQEIHDLASVLGRDIQAYETREDDTVTLLWKKGFKSIRYQTVDVYASDRFALLQEDLSENQQKESQQNERKYLDRFIQNLLNPSADVLGEPGPIGNRSSHHQRYQKEIAAPVPPQAFQKSPEETEALSVETSRVGERDYLAEVSPVFCEVLEESAQAENFVGLVRSYRAILESLLHQGDLRKATEWLKRLRGVQAFVAARDELAHQTVEQEIAALCTADLFSSLGDLAQKGIRATPEDWTQFLTYVGTRSIDELCELFARLSQETLHTAIVEHLIEHAPDQIEAYVRALKRPEEVVVRDMVRILAALLEEKMIPTIFANVAIHPLPEVRLEVVRAMKKASFETSRDFLRRAIKDPAPAVRELAFRLIAQAPDAFYAKPLAEEAAGTSFEECDAGEKKLALVALARCGGSAVLDFLKQIVQSSHASDAHEELRVAAVNALGEIADPRARSLLEEIASKTFVNRAVRETAKQLLNRPAPTRPTDEEPPNV